QNSLPIGDVTELSCLPRLGWEIPVAGAGFMVVPARTISDLRITPVVETNLQQCSPRDSRADFDGTTFQLARRNFGPRRSSPEMPNAVALAADFDNHTVPVCGM